MVQNAFNADSHQKTSKGSQWVPCRPTWDPEEAYGLYLQGLSLRKLEKIYGIPFYTIYRLLLKEKGPLACQVANVSLVRSVLRDQRCGLEALEGYERYLGGTDTHRPQRTMNNLSKYKTVFDPERTEKQAYQGPSPWDYAEDQEYRDGHMGQGPRTWRLPLYTKVVGAICIALEALATEYPSEPMAL